MIYTLEVLMNKLETIESKLDQVLGNTQTKKTVL